MATRKKLYKLTVVKGDECITVYGREAEARHEYQNGRIYDLEKCSCSGNFFYHKGGRVFIADEFAERVPESALNKFRKIGGR